MDDLPISKYVNMEYMESKKKWHCKWMASSEDVIFLHRVPDGYLGPCFPSFRIMFAEMQAPPKKTPLVFPFQDITRVCPKLKPTHPLIAPASPTFGHRSDWISEHSISMILFIAKITL